MNCRTRMLHPIEKRTSFSCSQSICCFHAPLHENRDVAARESVETKWTSWNYSRFLFEYSREWSLIFILQKLIRRRPLSTQKPTEWLRKWWILLKGGGGGTPCQSHPDASNYPNNSPLVFDKSRFAAGTRYSLAGNSFFLEFWNVWSKFLHVFRVVSRGEHLRLAAC